MRLVPGTSFKKLVPGKIPFVLIAKKRFSPRDKSLSNLITSRALSLAVRPGETSIQEEAPLRGPDL